MDAHEWIVPLWHLFRRPLFLSTYLGSHHQPELNGQGEQSPRSPTAIYSRRCSSFDDVLLGFDLRPQWINGGNARYNYRFLCTDPQENDLRRYNSAFFGYPLQCRIKRAPRIGGNWSAHNLNQDKRRVSSRNTDTQGNHKLRLQSRVLHGTLKVSCAHDNCMDASESKPIKLPWIQRGSKRDNDELD